ncbi:CBS domain-containing protein [Dissulfurirhabdus thermomarina]|uniref:CBS domain-containing protein n=1 Tax=Dissulfurirhabdus thermomarina TaxID=1765737 RepID=A0A6N9TMW3_DISTH|nr:CBS domain-containing protein [Dissulfurirhabdus thermomarina]NDY42585.1 CBS domain-containing protein [Dissulfurirhabdus thermomarina]NMX24475.1 CBS domain-containing protein [Dissulfurirhabdus thermomarina]
MQTRARDIMTAPPLTVREETPVTEFARRLLEHRINGMPVVDAAGRLVGVATEGDLVDQCKRLHIPTMLTLLDAVIYLESPRQFERDLRKMAAATVGEICTRDPVTVDEDAALEEVASLMSERKVYTLPVLKDGELVGVIGRSDVVRSLVRGAAGAGD